MNIKKRIPKFISLLLSFAMAFGGVTPVYATEVFITERELEDTMLNKTELETTGLEENMALNESYEEEKEDDIETQTDIENRYEEVEVKYNQSSSFFVTIPKTIVLGADRKSPYSIKVEGDIVSNKQICVVPVDGITDTEVFDFYMEDQITGSTKDDVVAEVNQAKFYWNYEDVKTGYIENDNYIIAEGLSAGRWKGIFQLEISMRTDPAHIHNYVGEVTKEPTCTETGEKTYTCDCGDSYTEEIAANGHHFEKGECTDCGEKDPDHEHNYTEKVTKEPTCTETGEKTYTCDCGDSYTEEISAKGHHFEDGECCNCGEKDPDYHKHSYTEKITKEPTCTEAGEKTFTCICGDSYTETIPAKGHNYVDGECTDCGEADPNYVYPIGTQTDSQDWDYTLDYENEVITLNYYKGNKTDVIVYGSYEINGVVYKTKIKSNTSTSYSTKYMFNGMAQSNCQKIKTITFNKDVDTSGVTSTVNMFRECRALTTLNLHNFDTSNVTDMRSMFYNCYALNVLDLSSFNTNKVKYMSTMFANCKALVDIDLSSFDTSNVTNMSNMFDTCISLTILDLTSFNTNKVTDMRYMFRSTSGLGSLNVIYVTQGKWNTSQANTTQMFYNCGTSNVTYK